LDRYSLENKRFWDYPNDNNGARIRIKVSSSNILRTASCKLSWKAIKKKGITELIVVGMMTHMCIDATVRAAVDLGYRTTLVEDACATRELSYQDKVVSAEQVHYSLVSAL